MRFAFGFFFIFLPIFTFVAICFTTFLVANEYMVRIPERNMWIQSCEMSGEVPMYAQIKGDRNSQTQVCINKDVFLSLKNNVQENIN